MLKIVLTTFHWTCIYEYLLFSFQYRYKLCPDVIWHTWSLVSSLHAHNASSLREFYANKSATIYRLLLRRVLQLCGLQKLKISLREFFVFENATRVDDYKAMLRLFLLSASITLCRCLQKKKKNKRLKRIFTQHNFGSRPIGWDSWAYGPLKKLTYINTKQQVVFFIVAMWREHFFFAIS